MKTDEELAREARAGSRRSFEELAARYRRRLFVYLRPRLGSDQDAEDMVQETFLKLYRNIESYDPAFRFSTWLYTSATRLAISSYRKKRAAPGTISLEDAREMADPKARTSGATETAELWETARAIGGNQFRALWLRYGEDMDVEDIARAIGKSRLAVRLLLHRARTNLMKKAGPAPVERETAARAAVAGGTPSG
jgi:RNA polymerase sigma-70 factor (ECF subfamily)